MTTEIDISSCGENLDGYFEKEKSLPFVHYVELPRTQKVYFRFLLIQCAIIIYLTHYTFNKLKDPFTKKVLIKIINIRNGKILQL